MKCPNCGNLGVYSDPINDVDRCPDCEWFGQLSALEEGDRVLLTIAHDQTVLGTIAVPIDITKPAGAAQAVSLALLPHLEVIQAMREEEV